MSYFSGTVNAMPKGGSTSADDRRGLGYAGPARGLGSEYSMGHPLYSPLGEWDDELEYNEDFDDIHCDIERLAFLSFNRIPTDSLAYKGTGIGYLGGIGSDMSAVIGMSAGYQPKGSLIAEQQLKEYIRETLIIEESVSSISSSGNIAVQSRPKGKNLGGKSNKPYHLDTNDLGSMGMTNGSYIGGKYKSSGKDTTDGAETVNSDAIIAQYIIDMEKFNLGNKSSSEIYYKDFDNDYMDNISKNISKKRFD
tara:strand:+ start:69 stop:821 length:753 start_codon:yes stop_codon:yes gene_type:complete